jgi:hypothetical protein
MKEDELRKHSVCSICNKRIGNSGLPIFWTVKAERHGIDMKAVKRQDGLSQYMGHPSLARVLGPDEEMTLLMGTFEATVCETCAAEKLYWIMEEED